MKHTTRNVPPGYEVTREGAVYSYLRGSRYKLTARHSMHGYPCVRLMINGCRRVAFVHKLVMGTFGPARPFPDAMIRHLNGDPADNRIENLAWGTAKENAEDRDAHGRTARGSRQAKAKLNESLVANIRRRVAEGELRTVIAREVGVSANTMSKVVDGRLWRHVDGSFRPAPKHQTHGTLACYAHGGCRCIDCKAANTAANKRRPKRVNPNRLQTPSATKTT